MKYSIFAFIIILVLFIKCEKVDNTVDQFDIILIAGQSNTHSGIGLELSIDTPQKGIFQLKRFNQDLAIDLAIEPLDHHTKGGSSIGFGLTFAKMFQLLLNPEKNILIIPCGYGGTGFIDNYWNPGDTLYDDAVNRTNYVLEKYPNSELKAILWHQGERDINTENYQEILDDFIYNLRQDVNAPGVPFILGGLVPYWTIGASRIAQNNIIKDTPDRVPNTGFADPTFPFVIDKPDNEFDKIHFNAEGQRELGKRYFIEYQKLIE